MPFGTTRTDNTVHIPPYTFRKNNHQYTFGIRFANKPFSCFRCC